MAIPTNSTPFSNTPPNTNVIDAVAVNDKFDRLYNYLQAGVEKVVPALAIPVGLIAPFASAAVPGSWLLCDGSAQLRSQYPDLFTALGVAYGAGDGTTTFNLPDLKGRAPIGKGAHADVAALAASDGLADAARSPKHVLTQSEIPAHTHTTPDHTHPVAGDGQTFATSPVSSPPYLVGSAGPQYGSGYNPQTGGVTGGPQPTGSVGGNGQHNHGFQVVNFIIRALP
jgi:microcystin-dependent protein